MPCNAFLGRDLRVYPIVYLFHAKQGKHSKTATRDPESHDRFIHKGHQHGDLVHNAENTTNMLAIQGLVEKARHAPEELQKNIIRAGLQRHLYPFEPRQKQVDAIWHLVFKKKDLLLVAKTSFGKSVIFQAAPLFCSGGIGLIIIPLDQIGQEQCIKIQRLPGARPVFINGRTDKTDILAQDIEIGVYTHLTMGPEIAAGWFRSISKEPVL
ncbi:MAG: hypothetical protein MMC33_010361 [Icmadophila ericetorum]|nr:hypothetical protein [Icmadophila ericetorum]